MATANESLGRRGVQYAVKLYIRNNSDTWVDFSAKATNDYLKGLGSIRHTAEGPHGQPVTKGATVKLQNADRYWDGDPPSEYDPWEGREVQLRLDISDATEENLATYRVAADGISTSLGGTAEMRLEPISEILDKVDADSVRQGQQWYRGRPWTFLAEELLRTEFGDSSGDLPSTYTIPDAARFAYPDGAKHVSAYGKPPQWDGSSWNADNTEQPRCVAYDDTGGVIYCGIAENLWRYTISTDTWENLGEYGGADAGVSVRQVFLCDAGAVALKWDDTAASPYETTLHFTFYDTGADSWSGTEYTSTTTDGFFSGQWFIFNGAYGDVGGTSRQRRGVFNEPPSTPEDYGQNLYVPFAQVVTENQSGDIYYAPEAGYDDMTNDYPAGAWETDPLDNATMLAEGYYQFAGASGTNDNLELRLHLGTKPNVAWERIDGANDGIVYYTDYDSGTGKWDIKKFTLIAGSPTTTSTVSTGGQLTAEPHGLVMSEDETHLIWLGFAENADATGYDTTSCNALSKSGGSIAGMFSHISLASNNQSMLTDILHVHYNGGAWDALIVKLIQDRAGKFPQYQLATVNYSGATEQIIDSSMSYFKCANRHNGANPIVYIDTQSGALKSLSSAADTTPTLLDSGQPPVYDAPHCMDFDYTSDSDPTVVGISAPHHLPDTQDTTPEGKYYLWQYADDHTGRVDLADFSDLSKLEALSQLCGAFRHSVYVNRDGDWVITPRDSSGASAGTIAPDRWAKGWQDARQVRSAPIVNFVELSPWEATLARMETSLVLRGSAVFNGTVEATQLDTGSRRARLRCIHGGKISDGNTRWDVLTFKRLVQTRLGAAYTSGTSVTLESVHDVEVGDQLKVGDSVLRDITAVNVTTKVVTIASGYASAYSILTAAVVTKANEQSWSSLGVTTLDGAINDSVTSLDVTSAADIAVGNYITIGEEEMLVTDKDGETITVTRGDNATSHSDADVVGMIVRVDDLDSWALVGNQGINVKFTAPSSGEEPFRSGDYVEFNCPGLELKQVKQSKIIRVDQDSIDARGKQGPKSRSAGRNRFMSVALAEYWADEVVTRYATRKRRYEIAMATDLEYFTSSVVTLKSERMLPDETSNELDCIVRDVVDEPAAKRTRYTLEEQ